MSVDTQVIVVGAGPVGLTAAMRLQGFGVSCLVLEAENELPEDLRASTFHPPTLDMLDDYGLAEPLIAQGLICPTWQVRMHNTDRRAVFELGVLEGETRHPFRLQCEQFRLCRLLAADLANRPGVEIRMGVAVERVVEEDGFVRVTVRKGEEVSELTALYVIGADGSRSVVREQVGLEMSGKTYPETTILAVTDFAFEDHMPGLSNVNYVWSDRGTFSMLRLRDFWRVSLNPELDETVEDALLPENIQRKLHNIVPRDVDYRVTEVRPYRVHMRIVEDYRKGRIILAGDAAHLNSPSGGMGMNGGVHDAFNLTEKLNAVLNGADPALLDLYTRQRRRIAEEEILQQADRNRRRMQERDPAKRDALMAELTATASDREAAKDYLMRSSMINGLRRAQAIP